MAELRTQAELEAVLHRFDAEEVFRMQESLSVRHVEKNMFRTMRFDSRKDFHRPENIVFSPFNPAWSNAAILPFGPAVHAGFPVIMEAWHRVPSLLAIIAGEMRNYGRNFTLVTNHGALFDIGLVHGALRIAIENWLLANIFTEQSTVIVSGGVRTLEVVLFIDGAEVVLPAIEVLQYFTRVLTSFPTTITVKSLNFDPELISASNELVRLSHGQILERGGQLVAMAPSASEDRLLLNGKHMQPLKNGTMDLMIGTWAIPVAVTLDGDEPPACTILEPHWLDTHESCHAMMEAIARQCHRQSLVEHTYHRKPSLYQQALAAYNRRHHRS